MSSAFHSWRADAHRAYISLQFWLNIGKLSMPRHLAIRICPTSFNIYTCALKTFLEAAYSTLSFKDPVIQMTPPPRKQKKHIYSLLMQTIISNISASKFEATLVHIKVNEFVNHRLFVFQHKLDFIHLYCIRLTTFSEADIVKINYK